ncbi:hypothetical protein BUALT_Bualt04G0026900 [Buddleja alternifolia]|uniref:Homeobox-leucine zipper protein n=1 Tax=Buddleja alternifolia TaxID=168488 RepID=A0AAV6XSL3_9LAMI|nr:hypothetical protein BUALT_Bualt04G0026900 [Buddleja alternifolia]
MKRLASSDSLPAFISIPPNSTDEVHTNNNEGPNPMYTREFQGIMVMEGVDEEEEEEEVSVSVSVSGMKKRRLRVDQVKALEKNFEVESKLEPERKVKLAQDLGLQPRQVAVWFQNRRARWKTKQLERDYGVLKASFDALNHNYESLQRDNQTLLQQIREIKSKLNEDESKVSVKEEQLLMCDHTEEIIAKSDDNEEEAAAATENSQNGLITMDEIPLIFTDHLKDGSSDSDSSAILNDHESPILHDHQRKFFDIHNGIVNPGDHSDKNRCYLQPQFVKIEEHNFFGHEESCSSLFTDHDQAPTLHWYSSEDWN